MELLKSLYKIYAPTGIEWPMIKFIKDYVAGNVPEAIFRLDTWGNIYITKGWSIEGFPTLCCHLDQAQKTHSEDFTVIEIDGILTGYSPSRNASEGIGADDKNGIWVCLKALEQCECLKVFMSVGEEKGCWGSNRANLTFFKDSLYILEPDCKGGEEIRTLLREVKVASKEFEEALETEKFGYVITEGKTTDILPLTLSGVGVSCANVPCGYHNPHKDDEYCVIEEIDKCLDFIIHTIGHLRSKFPHMFKTETQKWVSNLKKIKKKKEYFLWKSRDKNWIEIFLNVIII